MANITNYSRSNSVKKGVNSVKEGVFCQVFFYEQKGYSCRRLFFLKVILPEIKTVSFSQEFWCSGAINGFRTGAFPRMFTYSTEHSELPGQCSRNGPIWGS